MIKRTLQFLLSISFLLLSRCESQPESPSNSSDKLHEVNFESLPPVLERKEKAHENYLHYFGNAPSLSREIVDSLVTEINLNGTDISKLDHLNKDAVFKNKLKVYSFYEAIDGTRALVILPILQVKGNDQLYAIKLYDYVACSIDSIIELNAEAGIYLLLGNAKADGSCHFEYAYVIQMKNGKVDLEYPAFKNRPYLNFCNATFSYDQEVQLLKYERQPDYFAENLAEILYYSDRYGKFKSDSISAQWLHDAIQETFYERHSFELKFDGLHFTEK